MFLKRLMNRKKDTVTLPFEFRKTLTEFFGEYIDYSKLQDEFFEDKALSYRSIIEIIDYLIDSHVFVSEEDMKLEALKSYHVILPNYLFEHREGKS